LPVIVGDIAAALEEKYSAREQAESAAPYSLQLEYVLKTQLCKDKECQAVHPMLVRIPMTRDDHFFYRNQHPCCWLPVLEDDETFEQAMLTDLQQLVAPCQRHQHTRTCYKYHDQLRQKHPEVKRSCRFHFGRELLVTSWISAEGGIFLRRLSHYTNNFNRYMLVSLRCNHDISCMMGMDSNAMAAVYYIWGYINKLPPSLFVRLPVLQTALARFDELKRSGVYANKTLGQQAGSFLATIQNMLNRTVETGMPMIMAQLGGFPETLSSHSFSVLPVWPFVAQLELSDRERGYQLRDEAFLHEPWQDRFILYRQSDGTVGARSPALDYFKRDSHTLKNLCLYEFVQFCDKVSALTGRGTSKAAARNLDAADSDAEMETLADRDEPPVSKLDNVRFAFDPSHPEYSTHVLLVRRLQDAKVPRYHGPKFPNRKHLLACVRCTIGTLVVGLCSSSAPGTVGQTEASAVQAVYACQRTARDWTDMGGGAGAVRTSCTAAYFANASEH
jgi:hypothetical protein